MIGLLGDCAGSCLVGKPWKRWIDIVKRCLIKRCVDFRRAMRMVQDRSLGVCEGEYMG